MRVPLPLSCWICLIWLATQAKSQLLACPSLDNLFTSNLVLTRANDTVGKNYNCTQLSLEEEDNIPESGYIAVSANAFAGMPELTTIYLDVNSISELPPGLFDGTPMLQNLNLGVNIISELPPGLFDGTPMLQNLNLASNNFSELPLGLFDGTPMLQTLNLGYNYFSELPPGLFDGTPMLQTLNLEFNRITALRYGIFSNTANLTVLGLQYNQLQCCEITGLLGLPDGVWPSDAVTCNLNGTGHTLQNATALLALYPNSCPCSNASNCAVQGTACVSGQTFKQCSNCSTGFYLNDTICSACSDASNCEEQGTACVSGETYKKCSTCSAGFYLNEIGACSGCLAGNECNNSMSTACPNGTYSAANASSCTTIQPGYYCLSYNLDHGCTAISVSNSQAASASSSTLVMVAAVIAGILLVGA